MVEFVQELWSLLGKCALAFLLGVSFSYGVSHAFKNLGTDVLILKIQDTENDQA